MIHFNRTTAAALVLGAAGLAQGQIGTGFTYQGRLTDNGQPASGVYDLSFRLYSSASALLSIGNPVALEDVQVSGGLFTVKLDFGAEFTGAERWLSISVRPGASTGAFTSLAPRQQVTPTPYAICTDAIALPLLQSGNTDNSLIPAGLFHIMQSGEASAIYGQTSGTGAALLALASGNGTGVRSTSATGRAGWFEINNNASAASTLVAITNGAGAAVEGTSTGTGRAVAGIKNGPQGPAGYFRVGSNSNTSPAVHAETTGNGPALYANPLGLGPALEIARGYIKVNGAGEDTPTPVFIHNITEANRTHCVEGYCNESIIDNPLCNNTPGAMLFVNEIALADYHVRHTPVGVRYDAPSGRWRIHSFGWWQQSEGLFLSEKFVVLVIRP